MLRSSLVIVGCVGFLPAQQFLFDTDPSPAIAISAEASVPVAGTRGWFRAHDASLNAGLYVTDGTLAGTQRVLDSWHELVGEFAGRLVFTMINNSQTGTGLFCTDGTVAGTIQLVPAIGTVKPLGSCNGRLLLLESLTLYQFRLWSTDLTPGGTFVLGTLNGEWFASTLGNQALLFQGPTIRTTDGLTLGAGISLPIDREVHFHAKAAPVLGGHAYFLVRYSPGGNMVDELWRTDGNLATAVATLGPSTYRRLARAGAGLVISGDANTTTTLFSDGTTAGTAVMTTRVLAFDFVSVGPLAFFSGSDGVHGIELWCTDGTDAGTLLLLDATPGSAGSSLSSLTAGATTCFCYVDLQFRLLASDGTVAGTRILPQQVPPVANSGGMAALGDTALVRTAAKEVLATDGTSAGTVQLTNNVLRRGMLEPLHAARLLGDLYFVSDDTVHGRELWRTNGTPGGTALVEDITPGPADSVGELVAMRGALWFGVGGNLYRSNGTAAGRTLAFATGSGRIERMAAGENTLSFRTPVSIFISQLWRSDGTTTVACVNQVFSFSHCLHVGDAIYYIWQSRLLCWRGEPNGGTDIGPAGVILGSIGERVVFANGTSVRITDGTVAATSTIGVLPFAATNGQANRRDGGTFLFVSCIEGNAYATDGTSMVALPVGTPSLTAGGDDLVYLQVLDPLLGQVLYATDSSPAGTQLVVDFGVLPFAEAERMAPLGSGNRILLTVRGDTGGIEPWISDGTPGGTQLLADLNPSGSSDPVVLGVAGENAYFVADDGVHGRELWGLGLAQVGAASTQEIGIGCPGSTGVPRLTSGDTPSLGSSFTVELSQALPNALAVWLFGAPLGEFPVGGGCTIYFQSLVAIFASVTDGAGRSSFALAIPNTSTLLGANLIDQAGVFDPLGVSPFGTATTPGLFWLIGG